MLIPILFPPKIHLGNTRIYKPHLDSMVHLFDLVRACENIPEWKGKLCHLIGSAPSEYDLRFTVWDEEVP